MASRPFLICPLTRATATAVVPDAAAAMLIRSQASSPDCRIASASMPGSALRDTYLRWGADTFLRSWLVFGAVGLAVLRVDVFDDVLLGIEVSRRGPAVPDAFVLGVPVARADALPDPVPDPVTVAPPDEAVLDAAALDAAALPARPSSWPPHAAVARTRLSAATRRTGETVTGLRRRG